MHEVLAEMLTALHSEALGQERRAFPLCLVPLLCM
jgi:hypothetical protein